ncbi:hypothetical protein GUJ93_ZPchr0010g9749 [Zizania palustris]|uniref:Uncharacterized protein n=1 Tax=Zizania palustris TaxID=103762 RepID=A0A8J5WDM6_ZIZPA|nr:hypothetical protein GUJ93_ZPchr0010g9749 [Zizania palustris]
MVALGSTVSTPEASCGGDRELLAMEQRRKTGVLGGSVFTTLLLSSASYNETQCLVQKAIHNIVVLVHGLEQLAAFQNMLLQLFLKRAYIVPKLIFLDQLCELSPYLPRSTLEVHTPYTLHHSAFNIPSIIWSFTDDLRINGAIPNHKAVPYSRLISLSHSLPSMKQNRVDTTPRSHTFEPGYHGSSRSQS